MKIKNLILLVFILISLNSFYQPVQINSIRFKNPIVRQICIDNDNLTKELIDRNTKILFREFVSLNFQLMFIDYSLDYYNSS